MSKKFLKILIGIATVILAVISVLSFFKLKKQKNSLCQEEDDTSEEEERLSSMDALDLSSLKFSRHYVDLR